LWCDDDETIAELKGDKAGNGYRCREITRIFTNQNVQVEKDVTAYITGNGCPNVR